MLKRILLYLTAGLVLAGMVLAQPTQNVNVAPACQLFLSFSAVGVSGNYDNRTNGCDFWVVSYSSIVFAGPLSISVQHAPNAAGGVPGAWSDYAGAAVLSGINPNTSTVGAESQMTGYFPWIRVNLSATGAGAGTVVGTLYGWRTGPPSTVSIGGVMATNLAQYGGVAVGAGNALHVQPGTAAYFPPSATGAVADGLASTASLPAGPMASFPYVYNVGAGTWDRLRGTTSGLWVGGAAAPGSAPASNPIPMGALASGAVGGLVAARTACDANALVTLAAAAGDTQVVALTAARSIRVCAISVGLAGSETASLVYGTGVNCAVGTTVLAGPYPNILALALDFPTSPLVVPAANALCVRQATGVGGGGVVSYAVY